MSDREALRLDFLKTAGLETAARTALPGDASTRRYERLTTPSGRTLMLMDQAPAAESQPADPSWSPERRHAEGWNAIARLSAGKIEAFAAVAAHLRRLGLSAPEVVALDEGCALIEWPERLGEEPGRFLGPDQLTVTISEQGEGRLATVSGVGRWKELIDHVRF